MSAVLNTPAKPAEPVAVIDRAANSELAELESEYLSTQAMVLSEQNLDRLMAFAKIMATGKVTVPDAVRNEGDCLAITMQAIQWRMNPFAVAQKTHIIQGKLGYEAQLVNAVINTMAPTKDRIHYEWFGPWDKIVGRFVMKTSQKGNEYRAPGWDLKDETGVGIKVWATLKGESEPRILELMLSQAATRNSTLWAEDPRQQLAYLGVKRWARLYCPDVILGVYTPDEVEQIVEREIGSGSTGSDKPKPYTEEEFAPLLIQWGKYVAAGKKTHDEIIATVKSKRPITADQEKAIRALPKADATKTGSTTGTETGSGTGKSSGPVVTFAQVQDKLLKASDLDLLDAAADLIGEVADEGQRAELGVTYNSRRAELTPK